MPSPMSMAAASGAANTSKAKNLSTGSLHRFFYFYKCGRQVITLSLIVVNGMVYFCQLMLWSLPGNKTFTMNKRAIMISGTPISVPGDTYGVVKLLNPAIYQSKRHFEMVHVAEKDFFGQVTEWKNLDEMHINLMSCAVRVLDSELDELPDVVYDKVVYELNKKHMALYNELVVEEMLKTDDGRLLDATSTTNMFHTLQRFVTSPSAFDINSVHAETNSTLTVDFQYFNLNAIAFSQFIANFLNTFFTDL